jgi:hypothetical protein
MNPSEVIERVSVFRGISVDKILGKSRKREHVNARHGAQYLVMKIFPKLTQEEMAAPFNRDRTTLLHARDAVNDSLSINDGQYRWVNQIELGEGRGDRYLEKLFAMRDALDNGYSLRATALLDEVIELRKSFLENLEQIKSDEAMHRQANSL